MASDLKLRGAAALAVSKLLRQEHADEIFPARLQDGERHILIALSSDKYGDLLERVAEVQGPANVVVSTSEKSLEVIVFTESNGSGQDSDLDQCDIGAESEIGLLLALLRKTRQTTQVRLVSPRYDAVLIDSAHLG